MDRVRRRDFLVAVGALLSSPLAVDAQQPPKSPRIGFLAFSSPNLAAEQANAFREGLRDLGYAEGSNVVIEYRWAEGRAESLPRLAGELVRLKVDVILATNSLTAFAAKKATDTIPIVFATAGDPAGLVTSISRPSGNVTGLSLVAPEIVAKQMEILKEAVPNATRMAVLSNPANPYTARMVKEVDAAARSMGVRVRLLEVREADAFEGAFSAVTKDRQDALLVLFDPFLLNHRARITEFANKNRLPAMYPHREYVQSGGFMAYGASLLDMFRHAATYVVKILTGAKPADLPVEQPTKFELVISLNAAKALGLTIPQSLLLRADEVIQ